MNFFFRGTTGTYLESSKIEQFQILESEGEHMSSDTNLLNHWNMEMAQNMKTTIWTFTAVIQQRTHLENIYTRNWNMSLYCVRFQTSAAV